MQRCGEVAGLMGKNCIWYLCTQKILYFRCRFMIEIRNFELILILLSMGSLCEEVAIWVNLLCVIFWVKYCCRASLIYF